MSRIPTLRVVMIGLLTLVVFGAAAFWAASIQRTRTGSVQSRAVPIPADIGQQEIGTVFQPLFGASIAAKKQEVERTRLEVLAWSDASHRLARIPVRRAMEILVDRDMKLRRMRP